MTGVNCHRVIAPCLFAVSSPAAELRTGDGCGDGDIEALGGIVVAIAGDEKAMVDPLTDFWRDTIAFVAHDDEPVRGEWLGVDVLTVEQGAVDGVAVG